MSMAFKNDRDQHIDEVKRCVFQWFEATRRRAWDETAMIDISLRKLGVSVRFHEPMVIDQTHVKGQRRNHARRRTA